jgi:hypothetical protein
VEGMPSLNQMLEVARKLRMEKEREKELQVRLFITVSTLIKKKRKFSSCIRKFRVEQLQSHIRGWAS